ncbi:MAG: DinB family protein [Candidatus Sumerlaeaceae bacterium]|nr:DinB family protein [Candidatus Sumerlaeaceae bacterium]
MSECHAQQLKSGQRFFEKVLTIFEEGDSGYAPAEGMFTVAQQVAHTAQTVVWFTDGTFSPSGFDMNFPEHEAEVRQVTSLAAARQQLADAFAQAMKIFGAKSDEEMAAMFPANDPIMPGVPRSTAINGIMDHTAHHRGSLAVYARLLRRVPPMPYA